MEFRNLGRTGARVSAVSVGSMMFGWRVSGEEAFEILDVAMDAGINLIDTSNSYGKGKSEEIVGKALARDRKRQKFLLATKFHYWKDGDDPVFQHSVGEHIIQQCEESLRRLKTDVIDLYQLHRPLSSVRIEETLQALHTLVQQGKVRWIGTSTFAAWQIVEAQWVSEVAKLCRFSCEQSPYNLLDRSIERELLPMAQTFGIGVLGYSPLAEGALTGKYRRNVPLPEDSRFARVTRPGAYRAQLTPHVFSVLESLETIAVEKKTSLACLSLAWSLKNSTLSTVIVGLSKLAQFQDVLQAMQVVLLPEDLKQIDQIVPPQYAACPYYQADFGPHHFRGNPLDGIPG